MYDGMTLVLMVICSSESTVSDINLSSSHFPITFTTENYVKKNLMYVGKNSV